MTMTWLITYSSLCLGLINSNELPTAKRVELLWYLTHANQSPGVSPGLVAKVIIAASNNTILYDIHLKDMFTSSVLFHIVADSKNLTQDQICRILELLPGSNCNAYISLGASFLPSFCFSKKIRETCSEGYLYSAHDFAIPLCVVKCILYNRSSGYEAVCDAFVACRSPLFKSLLTDFAFRNIGTKFTTNEILTIVRTVQYNCIYSKSIVKAMRISLRSDDKRCVLGSIELLDFYGPFAASAEPELRLLTASNDIEIRQAAHNALFKVCLRD